MSEEEVYGQGQVGYGEPTYYEPEGPATAHMAGPLPDDSATSPMACPEPGGQAEYNQADAANGEVPQREPGEKRVDQLSPKELGREGEKIAATYLMSKGYKIADRNWTCSDGEIDIVARTLDEDGHEVYVLLEVKTRLALGVDKEAIPELSVDALKQAKYRRLALKYLYDHPAVFNIRFDVIAVNIVGMHLARLRHLCGAFEWDQ